MSSTCRPLLTGAVKSLKPAEARFYLEDCSHVGSTTQPLPFHPKLGDVYKILTSKHNSFHPSDCKLSQSSARWIKDGSEENPIKKTHWKLFNPNNEISSLHCVSWFLKNDPKTVLFQFLENKSANKADNEKYTAQVNNIILEKNRKPWEIPISRNLHHDLDQKKLVDTKECSRGQDQMNDLADKEVLSCGSSSFLDSDEREGPSGLSKKRILVEKENIQPPKKRHRSENVTSIDCSQLLPIDSNTKDGETSRSKERTLVESNLEIQAIYPSGNTTATNPVTDGNKNNLKPDLAKGSRLRKPTKVKMTSNERLRKISSDDDIGLKLKEDERIQIYDERTKKTELNGKCPGTIVVIDQCIIDVSKSCDERSMEKIILALEKSHKQFLKLTDSQTDTSEDDNSLLVDHDVSLEKVVTVNSRKGEALEVDGEKPKSTTFFAWGTFQNSNGNSQKVTFI